MGQGKEKEPKVIMSDLVQSILSEFEESTGPLPWNGQGKKETIEILNELEDHLKTFFEKGDRTLLDKFLDSDPEIEELLITERIFYNRGSILSHMRKKLEKR